MAVESIDIALGTSMPPFTLPDPEGKMYSSEALIGTKGLLVIFTCNHCPYAQAVWPRTTRLAAYAKGLGINTVAINPNIHPNYPDDAPEVMRKKIQEWGISFPYLIDETQNVARSYKAQCTPDLYLFGPDKNLVYHGRVDDNWQEESKVTREELKDAITSLASGKTLNNKQYPSLGCSIKWRQ